MLSSVRPRVLFAAFLLLSGVYAVAALGQSPLHQPELTNRIRGPIDETQVVTLAGNVHPRARAEFDRGVIPGETFLAHMVLELEPSAAQQAELDTLVKAQYDPASPLFHRWLSPADYGARFGASPEERIELGLDDAFGAHTHLLFKAFYEHFSYTGSAPKNETDAAGNQFSVREPSSTTNQFGANVGVGYSF